MWLLLSYAFEAVLKHKYNHLAFLSFIINLVSFYSHFLKSSNTQNEKLVLLYFIWHGWRHKNTQDTIQTSCEQLQTSVKSEFILHRGEQDHNGWFYNIVEDYFKQVSTVTLCPTTFILLIRLSHFVS